MNMEKTTNASIANRRRFVSVRGVVSVASTESKFDKFWRRAALIVSPLAAMALLFATLVVGITTLTQSAAQADAEVDTDRLNTALSALADAHAVYDRGARAISAVDQYQGDNPATREFVSAAGQAFDTSRQIASSSLVIAAAKSTGYPSRKSLKDLEQTAAEAHAAISDFFSKSVRTQQLEEEEYRARRLVARDALHSLLVAINNGWNSVGCDFGYRNGKGGDAFASCPIAEKDVPKIKLPPGFVRDLKKG